LLTFAKGGAPVREDVNLGALVEEIARFDLSGSNVMLVFEEAVDLWKAKADKGQIQQVISNLTINARELCREAGTCTSPWRMRSFSRMPCRVLPPGKYIKVTVRDEGVGIDAKWIDRVFDPYFSTKQTGSGLGLTTV